MEPLEPTPEADTVAPHEVEAAVSVARRIEENVRRAVKVRDDILQHVIVSLLAEEAARRGATVTVIAANVSLPRRAGITYVDVETAAELAAAADERFDACDVLLMAAAVSDYRPAEPHAGKLKKDRAEELRLRLVRTTDVLATLAARRRPGQLLVGFAAEHGAGAVEYGRGKLARKGLDAVVVNDVGDPGIGFDADANEVTVITADDELHVPRASKNEVAAAILDAVLSGRSSPPIKVPR